MRLMGKIPGEATKGLSVISAHWVSFVVEQCTLIPYHVSLSETSILYYYKILSISLLILWNGQAQEFRSTPNKKQCPSFSLFLQCIEERWLPLRLDALLLVAL
jgi:hypothetical protein